PSAKTIGKIEVSYWEKWTSFERDAMQAVVDEFNRSQDKIFVNMLTVSQIDQKAMLAIAGGEPPDIVGLFSGNTNVYAEKNALMPLDDYLKEAHITKDDYIPIFWDMCQYHGHTCALP